MLQISNHTKTTLYLDSYHPPSSKFKMFGCIKDFKDYRSRLEFAGLINLSRRDDTHICKPPGNTTLYLTSVFFIAYDIKFSDTTMTASRTIYPEYSVPSHDIDTRSITIEQNSLSSSPDLY